MSSGAMSALEIQLCRLCLASPRPLAPEMNQFTLAQQEEKQNQFTLAQHTQTHPQKYLNWIKVWFMRACKVAG